MIDARLHIRLLLIAVPQLLQDLIMSMAAQHEIDFVDSPAVGESVQDALARTRADVVLVGIDDDRLSEPFRRYLDAGSPLRVVTLRDDGRHGAYYDVAPVPITTFTRESLLEALAVGSPA